MNEYREAIIAKARQLRSAMDTAAGYLTDAQVSTAVAILPGLSGSGELVKGGTRINWEGQAKRAAADLWDRPENWPDAAPGLWEDINYRDGVRVIPEPITVGLAFSEGELGWWRADSAVYRSKVNANVYTPAEYSANWERVES